MTYLFKFTNINLFDKGKNLSVLCAFARLFRHKGFTLACRIAGLIPLLLVYACNQKEITNAEKQSITDEITAVLNKYSQAVSENGLMAEFAFLDSSAEFYWIPPGYTSAIKYDSVKAIITSLAPGIKSMDNKYLSIKIWPYSKTHAGYTAQVNSISADTSGNTNNTNLIESGTMIKRKDGWKLLSGHTSVVK